MTHVLALALPVLASAASLALVQRASPADDPSAAEVLARSRAALGSAAALDALRGVVFEGTVSFEGFGAEGTFRDVLAADGRARSDATIADFGTMSEGSDGEVFWYMDAGVGVIVHPKAEVPELARRNAFWRHVAWDRLWDAAELEGREELDGRSCFVVRLTADACKPDALWIDAETYLPARFDTWLPTPPSGTRVPTSTALSDWREVGGVRYPHERRTKIGEYAMVHRIASVEPNADVADDVFALPQEVADELANPRSKPDLDDFAIRVEPQEEHHVATVRFECTRDQIGPKLAVHFPEVMQHLAKTGTASLGAPFARYQGADGERFVVEAGMRIAGPIEPGERVRSSTLPAGDAAVAIHVGSFETLADTYAKLEAWIAASGYESAGAPWEVYWTDPGIEPDPQNYRTQVLWPVRRAFVLERREPVQCATVRVECDVSEIGPSLAVALPQVATYLGRNGVTPLGAPFSRYVELEGRSVVMEAGMMVAKKLEQEGRVRPTELPGGHVAVAWHVGPYEQLESTAKELEAWIAERGLRARGGQWHVYWTDPGLEPDPAKWRTEIVQPVEQANGGK